MKPLTAMLLALVMARSGRDAVKPYGAEKRPPPHACQPYAEKCTACKDCTKCGHCSRKGGKCSVCFKM
jgi:hypothetical protein